MELLSVKRRGWLACVAGWRLGRSLTQRAATMRIGNVLPKSGPVAQLGARFHGMEEVTGSIPVRSTKTSFSNTMQCKSQRTGWLFLCASFRPGSTVTRGAKQLGSGEYRLDCEGGGETGIRTLDTLRYTRFPSVRLKPLGHLSFVGEPL